MLSAACMQLPNHQPPRFDPSAFNQHQYTMKINTITGGKAGFTEAIHEAFMSNASNPTIRYSQARGFHVESGLNPADHDVVWSALNPADHDVVWSALAYYSLNNNGARSIKPSDYPEIRMDILDIIDA